jgi:FkbM family methyltransferase
MKFLKQLIPPKYLFTFVNIKNSLLSGFRKEYYSQSGEDIFVNKLLPEKNGFYVDVGAFHPKHYLNTYLLYKKGWKGINIDPNPATIKLFKKNRKNDTNLQLGIFDGEKDLTYYKFSHASCNTFSKEQAEKMKVKKWIDFLGTEIVRCTSLREIFKKYLPNNQTIDLLNVDAEGFDEVVLRSNDWERYKPRVIIVESPDFNIANPDEDAVYNFLKSKSYVPYAFTGLSLIFVTSQ